MREQLNHPDFVLSYKGSTQVVLLPIEQLKYRNYDETGEDEYIPEDHIDQLAASISAGDVMPPISAEALGDGTYDVLDGNHRVTAAVRLEMTHVSAVIVVHR